MPSGLGEHNIKGRNIPQDVDFRDENERLEGCLRKARAAAAADSVNPFEASEPPPEACLTAIVSRHLNLLPFKLTRFVL
jgi:hypothetical protein